MVLHFGGLAALGTRGAQARLGGPGPEKCNTIADANMERRKNATMNRDARKPDIPEKGKPIITTLSTNHHREPSHHD